jgi:SAM-dependent methyltransferase
MGEEEAAYLRGLVAYYNEARVPKTPGDAAGFRRDVENDSNHWATAMIADLRSLARGKRVLEIAAGLGRWTQFMADEAEFVLATDSSPNLLANAAGLGLPAQCVEFRRVDAFDIGLIEGAFDVAVHLNFFNHLPATLAQRFNDVVHERMGIGASVFAGGQQYSSNWKQHMYPKPGSPDTFSIREEEGFRFEIVDNQFDEQRIRGSFAPRATDLQIRIGRAFWWATYAIG